MKNLRGLMMGDTLLKIAESRLFELWILCRCVCIYMYIYIYVNQEPTRFDDNRYIVENRRNTPMGWLWLVGSIKLQVSFVKEPYKRDSVLQKIPIILSILLTVATPCLNRGYCAGVCVYIYKYVYLYMLDENLLGLMMVSTLLKIVESRLFELWILCRCVCIYIYIYILCRCVCAYICIYILDENLRGLMMGDTL